MNRAEAVTKDEQAESNSLPLVSSADGNSPGVVSRQDSVSPGSGRDEFSETHTRPATWLERSIFGQAKPPR
jgi:hypothetical protein